MLRAIGLVEHVIFLQDHADVPPHVAVVERLEVDVIEEDCALGWFEQPGDQLDQRRLPAAAPADDRDRLSRARMSRSMSFRMFGASGPPY